MTMTVLTYAVKARAVRWYVERNEVLCNEAARSGVEMRVVVVDHQPGSGVLGLKLLDHESQELLELCSVGAAAQHHDWLPQAVAANRAVDRNAWMPLLVEDYVDRGVARLPAAALLHPHVHARFICVDDRRASYHESC